MHTRQTLTYFSTLYGPNGNARRVAISPPYIASIADDPHYSAPPPPPEPEPPGMTRASCWSKKLIRRTMGRDRDHTARLVNRIGYERTVRRIEREGV